MLPLPKKSSAFTFEPPSLSLSFSQKSLVNHRLTPLEIYASVFRMLALLLLRLLVVHTARLTPEKRIYFRIINRHNKCSNDDFEANAFECFFESITVILLYTSILDYFAIRSTELRLAIRLGQPLFFSL